MKYLLTTLTVVALIVSCGDKEKAVAMNHENQGEMKQDDHATMDKTMEVSDGEKLIYYTCPMASHKHVHSSESGVCPECNMTLVPGVITSVDKLEYYGCPMEIHSHVRQDAPGRCAECKMELKPMRLKKSA